MARSSGVPHRPVLLLIIAAAGALLATSASASCPHNGELDCAYGSGAYHLSCYSANITAVDADAAKDECIDAWEKDHPDDCSGSLEDALDNAYGCPTAVVYRFGSAACRKSYQDQEKTNPLCAKYAALGLASPENRAVTEERADWECQHCPHGIGSYHLSCYKSSVDPKDGKSAKRQCLEAWGASASGCLASVTEANQHLYGCRTAVVYKFNTEACRASYQAQEKNNTDCSEYASLGLAEDANRAKTKFATEWECERCDAGLGSYHHSCYQAAILPTEASAAKAECLDAWIASANVTDCVANVTESGSNHYGCPSSVVYRFSSEACRSSYQAQEKANELCLGYIALGLANSTNRASSNTAADWECA